MTATYPGTVRPFTVKRDDFDTVYAADVDSLQDEIVAIESTLGTNPNISTTVTSSGTFNPTSTSYATVKARLANIEAGIVADTHTQYLKNAGGSVINNSTAAIVALQINAASGQTSPLQVWATSAGTTVASVSQSGTITAASVSSPEINNQAVLGIFA
jgi:hypothetical protein